MAVMPDCHDGLGQLLVGGEVEVGEDDLARPQSGHSSGSGSLTLTIRSARFQIVRGVGDDLGAVGWRTARR